MARVFEIETKHLKESKMTGILKRKSKFSDRNTSELKTCSLRIGKLSEYPKKLCRELQKDHLTG